jgi:hypothetical protein
MRFLHEDPAERMRQLKNLLLQSPQRHSLVRRKRGEDESAFCGGKTLYNILPLFRSTPEHQAISAAWGGAGVQRGFAAEPSLIVDRGRNPGD